MLSGSILPTHHPPRPAPRVPLIAAICVLVVVTGCGAGGSGGTGDADPVATHPTERLRVQVLEALPHDPNAFTQGLEVDGDTLYESTGLAGESTVRATDLATGDELARIDLDASLFGEGMTVTPSAVWQLTWKDGVAVERDPTTLAERRRVSYSGEGWGLCYAEARERLVMSDGSDRLTFRDPATFERIGEVAVRAGDNEVADLNELECVDDQVYANVWQTDTIVRIDADTGAVTAAIDASGLLSETEAEGASVLNGIAAIPGTDEFLITGKLWPTMFRVRFVPE